MSEVLLSIFSWSCYLFHNVSMFLVSFEREMKRERDTSPSLQYYLKNLTAYT